MLKYILKITLLFSAVLILASLSSCGTLQVLNVYFQDETELPQVPADYPFYAEAGSEDLTKIVLETFPKSVAIVEQRMGGKLLKSPTIVLCRSVPCYEKYALITQAMGETMSDHRIALNGEKLLREQRDLRPILTHELVHFYWFSRSVGFQPRWFEEGLAVWASAGGGADKVSVAEATLALKAGKQLVPHLEEGFFKYRSDRAEDYGIEWQMFYRQAGMFVEYLAQQDAVKFKQLLTELEKTRSLQAAWSATYTATPVQLWANFVKSL